MNKPNDSENQALQSNTTDFLIDGINIEKGLLMTGGNLEVYHEILTIFYKDNLQKVNEIEVCAADKNISLYTIYVHGLKSAAANIGAEKLSKDFAALEAAANQADWDYINKNNTECLSELKKILGNINNVLSEIVPSSQTQDISVDIRKLSAALNELKRGLSEFDSEAIDRGTDALAEYSKAGDMGQSIENILHSSIKGEYKAAISSIDILLRELRAMKKR